MQPEAGPRVSHNRRTIANRFTANRFTANRPTAEDPMRYAALFASATIAAALTAQAQEKSTPRADRTDCPDVAAPRVTRAYSFHFGDEENRAALGIGTTSGGMRDTLGLLVTEVTADGPADKAGIEEGDRLQAVNGTELRLGAGDAGDSEMRGLMARRLVRILDKLKPGDAVDLRVYADGKTRAVKVTTVKASELFREHGLLGLNREWLDGTKMKLDGLRDQLGKLRNNTVIELQDRMGDLQHEMGKLHYEISPDANVYVYPHAPPTPPVPPVGPLPPTPPVPPDAPRRMMRRGGPVLVVPRGEDVVTM
jgi:hypothetical protein